MDSIELNFHLDMWLILSGTSDPGVIYSCLHYKMEVDYDWHAVDALAVDLLMFATIVVRFSLAGGELPWSGSLTAVCPRPKNTRRSETFI